MSLLWQNRIMKRSLNVVLVLPKSELRFLFRTAARAQSSTRVASYLELPHVLKVLHALLLI
jgi:hypothetical protein